MEGNKIRKILSEGKASKKRPLGSFLSKKGSSKRKSSIKKDLVS